MVVTQFTLMHIHTLQVVVEVQQQLEETYQHLMDQVVVALVKKLVVHQQVEQEILPPLLPLKVITVEQELLLLLIKVDQAVERLELEQLWIHLQVIKGNLAVQVLFLIYQAHQ